MLGNRALLARVRGLFIGASLIAVAAGALTFVTARPPSPTVYDKTSLSIVCAQAATVTDSSGEHQVIWFSNFSNACQNLVGAGYEVQPDAFQPALPSDPNAYLGEATVWTPQGSRFNVAALELDETVYATDAYAHPPADTPQLQSNRMIGEIIAAAGLAAFILSLLTFLVLRKK